MKIPVLGVDPSLRNWGLAAGMLDMSTGILSDLTLTLVETKPDDTKQVRQSSKDIKAAEDIASGVIGHFKQAKVIFVEVPVGSQSAGAMKSYGICVGVLGALRAMGYQIIEVTPTENKIALADCKTASKQAMIDAAVSYYPEANWLRKGGKLLNKNEHLADAVGAIHAGVLTPAFKNLMRLFSEV